MASVLQGAGEDAPPVAKAEKRQGSEPGPPEQLSDTAREATWGSQQTRPALRSCSDDALLADLRVFWGAAASSSRGAPGARSARTLFRHAKGCA